MGISRSAGRSLQHESKPLEGAEALVDLAGLVNREVAGDDIHDVARGLDLFLEFHQVERHRAPVHPARPVPIASF